MKLFPDLLSKPYPGLVNCLASGQSTSHTNSNLSVLTESGAHLVSFKPTLEGASTASESSCDNNSCSIVSSIPHIIVQTTSNDGTLVYASQNAILLFCPGNSQPIATFTDVPFQPRFLSCANVVGIGLIVAVAGARGVALYRLSAHQADEATTFEQVAGKAINGRIRGSRIKRNPPTIRNNVPPQLLSATARYECVAVAVSEDGHIAAATVDGRLFLARFSVHSVRTDLAFIASFSVFHVPSDHAPHDRITDMVMVSTSPTNSGGCERVLVRAWWSGKIEIYGFEQKWLHRASFKANRPTDAASQERFCVASGVFLCVNKSNTVVAACTGQGILTFLDALTGALISEYYVCSEESSVKVLVKGLASLDNFVAIWCRDASDIILVPFPTGSKVPEDNLLTVICDQSSPCTTTYPRSSSSLLFVDATLCVKSCPDLKAFALQKFSDGKDSLIPFPLRAANVIINYSNKEGLDILSQVIDVDTIIGSDMGASRDAVAIVMDVVVFVYSSRRRDWAAVISPVRLQLCAVAVNAGFRRVTLMCCSSDGRAWRWDAITLKRVDPFDRPLLLPDNPISLGACLNQSGMFGCLAASQAASQGTVREHVVRSMNSTSPFPHLIFAVVESGAGPGVQVRTVKLSEEFLSQDWKNIRLGGLWRVSGGIVILVACWSVPFSAYFVDTSQAELVVCNFRKLAKSTSPNVSFVDVVEREGLPWTMIPAVAHNLATDKVQTLRSSR